MSRRRKKKLPLLRVVRSLVSVVILSSLVLGITLLVKQLESLTPSKIGYLVSSTLSKVNINLSEDKAESVAYDFSDRLSQTSLSNGSSGDQVLDNDSISVSASNEEKNTLFKVAIVSDIQQDFGNLEKTLDLIKESNYPCIFIIGDFTDYGDTEALTAVKDFIDSYGIEYYSIPGDHDIAASYDASNFKDVFGYNFHKIEIKDYTFLMLDNSPNYTLVDDSLMSWFKEDLEVADFVILSQPLYVEGLNLPFSKIYMGSTQIDPESESLKQKQGAVRDQGTQILQLIRSFGGVKAIFAGDHHKSSELVDPVRNSLKHYTVGAVSSTVREYPQSLIQTSRFTEFVMYESGNFSVKDIVLE